MLISVTSFADQVESEYGQLAAQAFVTKFSDQKQRRLRFSKAMRVLRTVLTEQGKLSFPKFGATGTRLCSCPNG